MAERWQQWMPFHIDKFRGSPAVQAMHPAARMGYLYLLCAQWQSDDCTLPSDDVQLAELSGLGDELWAQYRDRILRNFSVCDNLRIANAVCRAEWEDARKICDKQKVVKEELSRKRSEAGKRGNAVRWQHRKGDVCDSQSDPKPSPTVTITSTSSLRRATRIPENFAVTDEHREFAQKNRLPSPENEIEKFRDYWRARAGRDGTKLDWDATFRNWLRNAGERTPSSPGQRQPRTIYATPSGKVQ